VTWYTLNLPSVDSEINKQIPIRLSFNWKNFFTPAGAKKGGVTALATLLGIKVVNPEPLVQGLSIRA